ncbi:hypothetical protein EX30DRAFT_393040 [Ascodesmis nigricans]|uniref:Uncharacterized protein n=1 Tax=Ascodesmis nigricans TaxID=341454 RepID=A0A4S2N8N4_9PEZI|nr:hypothetical protein EX30DRAFT_393040 [Ascodesmis nigricans]
MNIFASAFARALSRQPPSAHLICRFTSSLSTSEREIEDGEAEPVTALSSAGRVEAERSGQEGSQAGQLGSLEVGEENYGHAMKSELGGSSHRGQQAEDIHDSTSLYPQFRPNQHQSTPRVSRPSPNSDYPKSHTELLRNLHRIGSAVDIPDAPPPWKSDLSYTDPFFRRAKQDLITSAGALLRADTHEPSSLKRNKRSSGRKQSLKEITGHMVKNWRPGKLREAMLVFDQDVHDYLKANDLSFTDIAKWAWVLKAPNTRLAGKRLRSIQDRVKIRPFLLLMLLRGRYLDRETLRFLVPHVERLLDRKTQFGVRDHKTAVVMFVRLLRKAREVWPLVLPRIAQMISAYDFSSTAHGGTPTAWVTLVYNRLLSLLAIPSIGAPFRHVTTLRDCQFTIIQKMAERGHPVTREGYRAIIRVHLALPKSEIEKITVRRMTASWPPWEEEHDGWDAVQRQLHGIRKSRASELLDQMVIAGYGHKAWEMEASVLAGKDTDGTPTIQTRAFLRRRQSLRRLDIWASRIRATRTIDEAWWNFLNYRRECPGRTSVRIYEEMFQKLSQSQRLHDLEAKKAAARELVQQLPPSAHRVHGFTRRDIWLRHMDDQARRNVAGDGIEVHRSTNEWHEIRPSSQPPTIQELWDMLVADNIRPTTQLVTLLLKESSSTEFAFQVLKQWDAMTAIAFITPLESEPPIPPVPLNKITDIPTYPVFTAYLHVLTKQGHIDDAIQLLRFHGAPYAPAWMLVMGWKVRPKVFGKMDMSERAAALKEVWDLYDEAKEFVEVENEMCRVLAVTVEKWVTGLREDVQQCWVELWGEPVERLVKICWELWGVRPNPAASSPSYSTATLATGPSREQQDAQESVSHRSSSASSLIGTLPPELIPSPVHLHHVIRAFGFSGRYTYIVTLLQHLSRTNTPLNGHMGTRVLIASRLFLEGATLRSNHPSLATLGEGEEIGRAALKEMDKLVKDEWGGWGGGGGRLGRGNGQKEGMDQVDVELEMLRYLQLGGLRRGAWADRESRALPLMGSLEGFM